VVQRSQDWQKSTPKMAAWERLIDFNGLSTKPEMYFSPTKMRNNKYKHRKNTGQCYMFWFKCSTYIRLFFENIHININTIKYNLSLNIKYLKRQFKDDSWAIIRSKLFL
jgi:hypothetical protein